MLVLLGQFAMPETCENWLSLVNRFVDYAHQTRGIYQVLPYSMDFKAIGELWNPPSKTVLSKIFFLFGKKDLQTSEMTIKLKNDLHVGPVNVCLNLLYCFTNTRPELGNYCAHRYHQTSLWFWNYINDIKNILIPYTSYKISALFKISDKIYVYINSNSKQVHCHTLQKICIHKLASLGWILSFIRLTPSYRSGCGAGAVPLSRFAIKWQQN